MLKAPPANFGVQCYQGIRKAKMHYLAEPSVCFPIPSGKCPHCKNLYIISALQPCGSLGLDNLSRLAASLVLHVCTSQNEELDESLLGPKVYRLFVFKVKLIQFYSSRRVLQTNVFDC